MSAPVFRVIARNPYIRSFLMSATALIMIGGIVAVVLYARRPLSKPTNAVTGTDFSPRKQLDSSGGWLNMATVGPWERDISLATLAKRWNGVEDRAVARVEEDLRRPGLDPGERIKLLCFKAIALNAKGDAEGSSEVLAQARKEAESDPRVAEKLLYTVVFQQGVAALRLGENENCVQCLGESACIVPISSAAVHTKRRGSSEAVGFFMEYLEQFPRDLEVSWLLNLAHMTLGEYPAKVDPRYLLSLDKYFNSEFNLGRFVNISQKVGLGDRRNQAGGAIMDDFDNDGRLDIVLSSYDYTQEMEFYRNRGDGTFERLGDKSGLSRFTGGLNCMQTDFNNDGYLDIFVVRGAWMDSPVRPSLLRNNGNGTLTDITDRAGLAAPMNAIAAGWADYDLDGSLDVFVCGEKQPNRLYRNLGDGIFKEMLMEAGLSQPTPGHCKGVAWLDFDNDRDPDLFLNYLDGDAKLYRNEGKGKFTDVTRAMGIDGPQGGFSCWAWDYNNDGWQDIWATCYDRSLGDVVRGLMGHPHRSSSNRLFRNEGGKRFTDVTQEAGLDYVFETMGSNFADVDNDGYLDMYLATGEPNLATLIPNRMFRNVGGSRFSEITASTGTGHLQKGHGVAFGDWDRDGDSDMFVELGGAVNGDRFQNALFENPGGHGRALSVKLVGQKSNRAAIGARIKVVTGGATPQTVYRHVTSGSSFGANTLEQLIGIGSASSVAKLEIKWPVSGTTQVFHNVSIDTPIEVREFATSITPRKGPALQPVVQK